MLSAILIFAIGMVAFMPYIVGYFDVHHQHGVHASKLMFVNATKWCIQSLDNPAFVYYAMKFWSQSMPGSAP